MRRPHAEFLFDEQAIGPDLEAVPGINPPSRRLPLLGNQEFALSYDSVRPSDNFQPLGDEHQVIEGERFDQAPGPGFSEHGTAQTDDKPAENEQARARELRDRQSSAHQENAKAEHDQAEQRATQLQASCRFGALLDHRDFRVRFLAAN